MKHSQNYKMNLPEKSDQYNLDDWNENTEKLDLELKKETDSRINNDNQLQSNINNSVSTLRNEILTAKNLANATGVLAVTKGGTGETTAENASNMFLNALRIGQDVPKDEDYYISQWAGASELPDTDTNKKIYVRRPISALWNYIKGKISSVLGLTASNYNGTSAKATADGSGNNIENSYALKKGGFSDFQSNVHYFKYLGGWSDFEHVVIPILEITSSITDFRFSNGKIFSNRYNGLYQTPYFEWYCNKQYNATVSENYFLSVKGICLWNVVTFIYNSKKYLGIAFNINTAGSDVSYFDGYASPMDAPLFTVIKYYHEKNGVINQEIYNSLTTVTDYSYSGFADTATKLATTRTINIQDASATNTGTGASFDGSGNATIKLPTTIKANITGNCSGSSGSCTGNSATATNANNSYRGMVHTCSTASGTKVKTVSVTGFTLATGACIRVLFTNGNNIANPTLNVNNTGAKEIRVKQGSEYVPLSAENGALRKGAYGWQSNTLLELRYDGTYWIVNENAIVHEKLNSELGYLSSRVFINGRKEIWGGTSPYDITANESKTMTISSDLPINDDISNHSLSVITEIESTYVNAYGDIKLMDNTLKFSIYSRNLTNNSYRVKTVHIFVTGY